MSWLKKQQPIQLYQSSEIPYIISEDGVNLCYANHYGTQSGKDEFNLSFLEQRCNLKRINTHFYKIAAFPITIPFKSIIYLDESIIEGKTIKIATASSADPQNVVIMKSEYIHNYGPDLSAINDIFENNDHSFLLVGDYIDPQIRLFDDVATIIHHGEWNRTLVTIAHQINPKPDRKYCWLQNTPDLSINCYGIDKFELKEIHDARDGIGVNASIEWVN